MFIMKKFRNVFAMLLVVCMMAGCGSADSNNGDSNADADKQVQEEALANLVVEDYVTLGEYKNLEVAIEAVSVTEAEIQDLMNTIYRQCITAENGGITGRAVETGDTVDIDFMGMKDGVAFDGGTAEGYELTIGSGAFIAGFEDGLIGVEVGETVDLNLTFPKGYGNADLAGQAVVFTVTVNFIYPDEIDESVIPNLGVAGVSNMDEFHEYAYNYLYQTEANEKANDGENAVVSAFLSNCTFKELPEALVNKYSDMAKMGLMEEAAYYGMDAERFVSMYYGISFDEYLAEYGKGAATQELAFKALANKENISITDEELEDTLLTYANNNGYVTVEEFLGSYTREQYREYFLFEEVIDFLMDNSVVTEVVGQ